MQKYEQIHIEDYERRRDELRMNRKLERKSKHKHRQEWMDELEQFNFSI